MQNDRRYHILLCDDDVALTALMADSLREHGWEVDCASDGVEAEDMLGRNHYDIIVLDIEMPRCSGYTFLQRIRPREPLLPIIMLSAHSGQEDIIEAYRLGCDDFVAKPFSMPILESHLRAVTRRLAIVQENEQTTYLFGSQVFDTERQLFGDQRLSVRETELLQLFCRSKGQVLDKHFILRSLWGKDDAFVTRSLAVYVHRLNVILRNTQTKILCLRGRGYRLVKVD